MVEKKGNENKALAEKEKPALATLEQTVITADDVKKFLCPTITDKELYMAMGIMKAYALNPFKREIYIIKYSATSPMALIVGYETYIKRAERSGKLNGWKVEVSADTFTATVTIYRKDWSQEFSWTVDKREVGKDQATWKTMPSFMLKKVAIAQGFRLCFSDELGGMPYTKEETDLMIQPIASGKPAVEIPEAVPTKANPPAEKPTEANSEASGGNVAETPATPATSETNAEPAGTIEKLLELNVGERMVSLKATIMWFKERETPKQKKPITDYTIGDESQQIKITCWGKAIKDVAEGSDVEFNGIDISEYKGELKYVANGIKLIPKGAE